MFNRIRLWWHFDGKHVFRTMRRGIKNLWKWFPVIWKDRDWDHSYIYEILKFKLQDQAHAIAVRDRHTSAQREAEKMLLCARLCQIQQDSLYEMEHVDYLQRDIEFVEVSDYKIDGKPCYEMKSTTLKDELDSYFAKYPRQHERVLSGKINMFNTGDPQKKTRETIAMEIAHENQKRSRRLLFKILDENIEGFWD